MIRVDLHDAQQSSLITSIDIISNISINIDLSIINIELLLDIACDVKCEESSTCSYTFCVEAVYPVLGREQG